MAGSRTDCDLCGGLVEKVEGTPTLKCQRCGEIYAETESLQRRLTRLLERCPGWSDDA
jgi:tRNA(Ile2) C34 agmatinyltransferase TiaS